MRGSINRESSRAVDTVKINLKRTCHDNRIDRHCRRRLVNTFNVLFPLRFVHAEQKQRLLQFKERQVFLRCFICDVNRAIRVFL